MVQGALFCCHLYPSSWDDSTMDAGLEKVVMMVSQTIATSWGDYIETIRGFSMTCVVDICRVAVVLLLT